MNIPPRTEDRVQYLLRLVRLQQECEIRYKAACAEWHGVLREIKRRGGVVVAVHPQSKVGNVAMLRCEVSDETPLGCFGVEDGIDQLHPELYWKYDKGFRRNCHRSSRVQRLGEVIALISGAIS